MYIKKNFFRVFLSVLNFILQYVVAHENAPFNGKLLTAISIFKIAIWDFSKRCFK